MKARFRHRGGVLDAAFMFAGRATFGMWTLLLLRVLNQHLPHREVGLFLTAQVIGNVGLVGCRGGFDRFAMRYANDPKFEGIHPLSLLRHLVQRTVIRYGAVGLLLVALGWPIAYLLGLPISVTFVMIVALLPWSISFAFISFFQANQLPRVVALLRDVLQPLVLVLLVRLTAESAFSAATAILASWTLTGILFGIVALKLFGKSRGRPWSGNVSTARFRKLATVVQIADTLRLNLDGLVITASLGAALSAIYWTAWRLSILTTLPFFSLTVVLSPKIAKAAARGAATLSAELRRTQWLGFSMSLAAHTFLLVCGHSILRLTESPSADLTFILLVILSFSRVIDAATGLTAEAMMFSGSERAEATGQLVSILACLIAFPLLASEGSQPVAFAASLLFLGLNVFRLLILSRKGISVGRLNHLRMASILAGGLAGTLFYLPNPILGVGILATVTLICAKIGWAEWNVSARPQPEEDGGTVYPRDPLS